jgi:excisionase family DNA binding protein
MTTGKEEVMSDKVQRRTYTVLEVAEILGIGRNTAYEVCRNGEIPTIRVGGRVLIPRSAIDELLGGAA